MGDLCCESRDAYRRIIVALVAEGVEGIILSCTEISLLIGQADADEPLVPLFDTTPRNAQHAAQRALCAS